MRPQSLVTSVLLLFTSGLACARPLPASESVSPSVSALPPVQTPAIGNSTSDSEAFGMTVAQILKAAPSTLACPSGATACRNANQIATFINKSFAKFGFTTPGEQAALFSLMAFETGNFVFDVNQFPGRPGQGTRNMMQFNFILPYALQYNRAAVLAIRPDLKAQSTPADVPSDTEKNAIRATVLDDTLSFASAAWFLRTKCPADIAAGLKTASADAFNAYMGPSCVGAGQDPARLAGYQATLAAMEV